ncbi:MAG: DNA mismatch repair endonuclease MutL, partial [Flavobacteriales bacterium]
RIELLIRNAGKTLIQVTDEGAGMSEDDARVAFERHATSKIQAPEDLFSIRSKGFRGEALASIAAIAHVEMKTRPQEERTGTRIRIEGGELVEQEPCQCPVGTTVQVKNLFYNVPARRNFLRSDPVEIKHILEEFQRIALTHPNVRMQMQNEGNPVHELPTAGVRQRIVNLLGKKYDQRLVPVEESTDIVDLQGFVIKPEFSKKKRGEQYLFVNERFIKHYYLDRAIASAYRELIPEDEHPSYFLYLTIDPSHIDINIHPTKTEIKFDDEKAVHAILQAAVKRSLGHYNIAPSLDFDQETSFDPPLRKESDGPAPPPKIHIDPDYDPFEEEGKSTRERKGHPEQREKPPPDWQDLYQPLPGENEGQTERIVPSEGQEREEDAELPTAPYQLHSSYILSPIRSGLLLIDQQKAHERILYEGFLQKIQEGEGQSQQLLFPRTVELDAGDRTLLQSMMERLQKMGFDLSEFGGNAVVVNGIPSDAADQDPEELLGSLLALIKEGESEEEGEYVHKIARALAKSSGIKQGQALGEREMSDLIDRLFACELPYYSPDKKATIVTFTLEELAKRFG